MKRKPSHHNAPTYIFDNAQNLRKDQTSAEKRLWEMLRNRQVKNTKFRRQHPISGFIADFYCHELKLIIELDGNIHDREDVKMNANKRQQQLEALGLTILRVTNDEIFEAPERVIEQIEKLIQSSS
ncbi:MAG: endonuclease domain-containing protein [Flavobacteriales bacterium]